MSDRYFGKVISVQDDYTVVINKGSTHGLKPGQTFKIVELGPIILDPDTGEELETLELVKGEIQVTHIQNKISTAESIIFDKTPDTIETIKTPSKNVFSVMPYGDTVKEVKRPGEKTLKPLTGVKIGDYILKNNYYD